MGAVNWRAFNSAIWSSMSRIALAAAFELLLQIDDRHVGDDGERAVEEGADLVLAILLRLGEDGGNDELVLARQLALVGTLLGGVFQNVVDGGEQGLGALVGLLARAGVLGRLLDDGDSLGHCWEHPLPEQGPNPAIPPRRRKARREPERPQSDEAHDSDLPHPVRRGERIGQFQGSGAGIGQHG